MESLRQEAKCRRTVRNDQFVRDTVTGTPFVVEDAPQTASEPTGIYDRVKAIVEGGLNILPAKSSQS